MRELPNYREELEQVIAYFGQKRVLTKKDIQDYTGRGRKWVDNHIPKQQSYTQRDLAVAMARLSAGR